MSQVRTMRHDTPKEPVDILLVEDNPGDVRLIEEAFSDAQLVNDIYVVVYGQEALDYLNQRGDHADANRPDIVLLDLNLPDLSGFEILRRIKSDETNSPIPIVVLTSSRATDDIARSYEAGANAYLTKPEDPDAFIDLARAVTKFWVQLVHLPPRIQ